MKQGIGSFRKLSTVVATAACAVFLVAAGTARAGEMSCASNGEFIRCPLKGADKLGVKMVSQQSDLKCHKDKTWGADSDGIWVDMGCVATFSYKGGDSSATAKSKGKSLGGTVYTPMKGVVCDTKSGFCADSWGISAGMTKEYMGADAEAKIMKIMKDDPGMSTTQFTLSNMASCDTEKRNCYVKGTKNVDKKTTQALFAD
jgi:Fels-1 Prophage Protein-like/Protein of unknown function (DUF3011)